MKKILILVIINLTITSCRSQSELPGYSFSNFKNTKAWDLAKAVENNDSEKVREILTAKKVNVDFKDPEFKETLLSLAIVNQKQNAIIELLKAGANPNELLGDLKDETPFINAINYSQNCDLFYIKTLLKYGANPNLEIKNPEEGHYFENSFPLLVAIGKTDNNGDECLSVVKLLVENGANINSCYQNSMTEMCEGVINQCLSTKSMETLKYFVIEKKINIPEKVYIISGINKTTQKVYNLSEILNTDDYKFEDLTINGEKIERSKMRKVKSEILAYLKDKK